MGEIVHLGVGVLGSWSSWVEEQIEVVATLTIQKVNKRPGKHFSLQQRIGEEQQHDSTTNYTNWFGDQSISSKDSQINMENKRSPGMKRNETTDLNNCEIMLEVMM